MISAIISAFSAVRLATYADYISTETKMGGFLAGTILLAVATSLPELTTTVSASIIGNANIAVGNGLGTIMFNIFILFILDIHFRKKRLFLRVSDDHLYTGLIALILCIISAVGLAVNFSFTVFNVSMTSLTVILVYFIGMRLTSKKQNSESALSKPEPKAKPKKMSLNLKKAVTGFVLYGIIILVAGSALAISGDEMAKSTGLSGTLIGSILVAFTTSIPDAMSTFTALRLANINMALGTILGSNLFNVLVVAIGDGFYFDGSIWEATSDDIIFIALVNFFLTAIIMLIIKRDRTLNTFTYILPALLAVISYLAVVGYVIFG
nr:sodium:calcium antiporter [Saliterribacillus persicus]